MSKIEMLLRIVSEMNELDPNCKYQKALNDAPISDNLSIDELDMVAAAVAGPKEPEFSEPNKS